MKKILFLKLLALVVCLSSALSATAYSFKSGGIYYNITSSTDKTVEVTNSGNWDSTPDYTGSLTIPSTVTYNSTTYTVTAIGERAFYNPESGYPISSITSISLPNTITSIGENAFSRNGFTTITIPNSVTTIGNNAFSSCYSLKTLNLGSGITSIPFGCFQGCGFTSVTIPNQVYEIGDYAFYNCTSLETVTLGFQVVSIGSNAFNNNQNAYDMPKNVYCYAEDPPIIQDNTFFIGAQGTIVATLYTLARSLSYFNSDSKWSKFKTRQSHSGNTYYDYCYNGIYYYFNTIPKESGHYSAYVTYKDTNYNSYSGQVTIPATMPWRGGTFDVDVIDSNAFRNCTGLTRFDASSASHLRSIYSYAFYGCTSLANVYLPSSLRTIENYAFYNCPLNYLKVPCSTPPTAYANTFTGNYNSCTVVVPKPADILTYQATDYWKKFLNYAPIQSYDFSYDVLYYAITGENTVKVVHRNLDEPSYNYSGNITIPSTVSYNGITYSVTAIDDYAFSQAIVDNKSGAPMLGATKASLNSVTIGSNVKTIGERAFEYASSLTRISIPNNVTSLGSEVFYNCTGLTQVSIGTGVTTIPQKAFSGCTALATISIPNNVTYIGQYAFTGCSALRNVTLGNSVSSIGVYAFNGCTNLYFINCLRNTPPTIQSSTFPSSLYSSNAKVITQNTTAQASYKAATYWKNFSNIWTIDQGFTNYVKASGDVTLATSGTYPWVMQVENGRCFTTSGNYGQHSTSSALTATATVPANGTGTLSFNFKAWGEGTSYDRCTFVVDGVTKFTYGARDNDWESYSVELTAGTHTLTWTYYKDSSVNPVGDYFAVDDVKLNVAEAYACYTPSNTTLTFYYDGLRSTRTGTTYDLNTGNNDTGWETDGTNANVTKVVFDPSFAAARPTTTYSWFYEMVNLQTITGMSYLNTSEVTNMAWMFGFCTNMTSLDVSHFNTANVTNMAGMFTTCSNLTSLDLSSFNTANVTAMQSLFYDCTGLRTIYAGSGWSTNAVTSSYYMFNNCTNLVGGMGTTYDANYKDKTYAHIDGGPSNPGYFTDINASQAGDVNGDGSVTIADVTALIDLLLNGGTAPAAADVNGDNAVTIADVTALIDILLAN